MAREQVEVPMAFDVDQLPILVVATAAATSLGTRTLLATCAALRLRRAVPPLVSAPPISVLKPLRGADERLHENLCSLLRQDYPGDWQLVLGVTDRDDPALPIARRVQAEHPEHSIVVIVGSPGAATNPKVANLLGIAGAAHHELWLVSDSNVRAEPDYLRSMVAELAVPGVGLVANIVAGESPRSLGAKLEALQLGGFIAGSICAADMLFGHVCVIGKSMLMRRDDLARLGGLRAFADVLGEDYAMGRAFDRAGMKVAISSHVVRTTLGAWTVDSFLRRHLRWAQMRRWIAPSVFAAEPLMSPTPWLVVLAALGNVWPALVGLAWALAIEAVGQRALHRTALRGRDLAWVPLKDVAMLLVWLLAWVVRDVSWRGHRYRIGPGSALTPISIDRECPAPACASAGRQARLTP
jgi:ceramide glucosyltransferase